MKRSRRGGRRPQGGGNGHNNSGGNAFNPNRVYDSTGPEIKIRGTASHVYEKYLQLARDANASGDRVMAENYLQHAEHYFRIMAAMQAQQAAQAEAKQAQAAAAQQAAQSAAQTAAQTTAPQPEEQAAAAPAAPARSPRPSRSRRNPAPAAAPAAAPGVGDQPSLGDDAGPSFSLNENSEEKDKKEKAPAGE